MNSYAEVKAAIDAAIDAQDDNVLMEYAEFVSTEDCSDAICSVVSGLLKDTLEEQKFCQLRDAIAEVAPNLAHGMQELDVRVSQLRSAFVENQTRIYRSNAA